MVGTPADRQLPLNMSSQLRQRCHFFVTDAPKVGLHLAYTFINGWLNGLTLRRYQAFSTMMVGNTILLMASLACNPENKGVKGRITQCPQTFEKSFFYGALIGSFCVGAIVAHILCWKCNWSSFAFAPIFICVVLSVEIADIWLELEIKNFDVKPVILACVFGMSAHLTLKGGLGALPWCTTGNIVAICFHGTTLALDPNDDDAKKMFSNILLWVSFASGVAIGVKNWSEGYLLLCICLLAGLLGINDRVFMKQNIVLEAPSGGQEDEDCVRETTTDQSSLSTQSGESAAEKYETVRPSFDMTPYLSTTPHRLSRLSRSSRSSIGVLRPTSPAGLRTICEAENSFLELGATHTKQ